MRWSTFVELAPQVGIPLPPATQNLKDEFLITQPMSDLGSVLRKFLKAQKVLASEEILARLAEEACEDAFNDGIRIIELRYAPSFINEGHPNLSYEKIHRAIVKGVRAAEKRWPIAVGLLATLQRIKSVEEANAVMNFVIDHQDEFVGVDLADDETKGEPRAFAPVFERARTNGLHVTIHSGEAPHAQSMQWVRESIEILGAERIGHGVQIIQDPAMIELVKTKDIPLEVCPWSNILTSAFPRPEDHPIRALWDQGVSLTFNSDDPGVFDSRLTDDYRILQDYHAFTEAEFMAANQIAARHSFIPHDRKQKVWPFAIPH